MELTKKALKNIITEVIEEMFSHKTFHVEESQESNIDIYDDKALLKYLQDKYIESLEAVAEEIDLTYEDSDFDEDSGKSWKTVDFDSSALENASYDKMQELAYDGLGLTYIKDPATPEQEEMNNKYFRVEEFMDKYDKDIYETTEILKIISEIEAYARESYADAKEYHKDPYAYYGVSRRDFM